MVTDLGSGYTCNWEHLRINIILMSYLLLFEDILSGEGDLGVIA